jgi:hypothetical protein
MAVLKNSCTTRIRDVVLERLAMVLRQSKVPYDVFTTAYSRGRSCDHEVWYRMKIDIAEYQIARAVTVLQTDTAKAIRVRGM